MALWLNVKRVARYGLIGFIRNGFVSLAAVFIMTITLFALAVIVISGAAMQSTLASLTNQVDVNIYFLPGAPETDILNLKQQLESLPEVASVAYTTPEEALAEYRERHANDQRILQGLELLPENPLGAELSVQAHETSQYESIDRFLTAQREAQGENSIIDTVNFARNRVAIERLTNIIETSRKIGIGIALVFGLASVLIAFNTLRLAIYTARDEIGVMRLVGAGTWYVRGPFMIAGILYGVIAAIVVLLVLYPMTAWIGAASEEFFGGAFNAFGYFTGSFFSLFLILFGTGVGLGALSSYLAVRRYLKA